MLWSEIVVSIYFHLAEVWQDFLNDLTGLNVAKHKSSWF